MFYFRTKLARMHFINSYGIELHNKNLTFSGIEITISVMSDKVNKNT